MLKEFILPNISAQNRAWADENLPNFDIAIELPESLVRNTIRCKYSVDTSSQTVSVVTVSFLLLFIIFMCLLFKVFKSRKKKLRPGKKIDFHVEYFDNMLDVST